jgi:predicted amidophosphoribosyltransferase
MKMEHLLAMMVSVPPSPGRMPTRAFQTMENLLAMMVSLPASPLSVGQATIIFFYIGF